MYEKTYNFDGTVSFRFDGILVDRDELAALREAVEVLEGMYHPKDAEVRYYRSEMNRARDEMLLLIEEVTAALEAVEVLEDMYAQRDAETEKWFQKWIGEYSDHVKTSGALRDAEAKVAELHRENADLRDNLLRFMSYGCNVRDRKTGKRAPFGTADLAAAAAQEFNAGLDAPHKYIWLDD